MLAEVRHFFPGRVRLFVPGLFKSKESPERIVLHLLPPDSVQKIRANRNCCSIVIEYDRNRPGILADLVNRLHHARSLEALISSAALTSANGNGQALAPIPAPETVPARQDTRPRLPLALPTASLILSFFVGPAVVAVNAPLMLWNAR
ncbi:MAG: HMA2 domain-containing protein, partial [Bryobacteraceae bacterium]